MDEIVNTPPNKRAAQSRHFEQLLFACLYTITVTCIVIVLFPVRPPIYLRTKLPAYLLNNSADATYPKGVRISSRQALYIALVNGGAAYLNEYANPPPPSVTLDQGDKLVWIVMMGHGNGVNPLMDIRIDATTGAIVSKSEFDCCKD
jgi:hypothetical protein